MKVFISWSGEPSKSVASTLKTWLQNVVQASDPWTSSEDIEAGSIWFNEISNEIQETKFGVLCLTPENIDARWMLWEAGAIYRGLGQQGVVPLTIGFQKGDLAAPLGMLQAKNITDEADVRALVGAVNARTDKPVSDDTLNSAFEKFWPDLQEKVAEAVEQLSSGTEPPQRQTRDLIEEVLTHVRALRSEVRVEDKSLSLLTKNALHNALQSSATSGPEIPLPLAGGIAKVVSAIPTDDGNARLLAAIAIRDEQQNRISSEYIDAVVEVRARAKKKND